MSKKKICYWLALRLLCLIVFIPTIQQQLFTPFISNQDINILDPWTSWLGDMGRIDAFPYGYVMFMVFLPAILLNRLLEAISINGSIEYILPITLLLIEFFLYKSLKIFAINSRPAWSWLAIFSPFAIYISYLHGQIDIIPTALLTSAILMLLNNSWTKAGFVLGAAIAAKFSFILALPFFVIFFLSKRTRYLYGLKFIWAVTPGLLLCLIPAIYSKGYRVMVLGTPEVFKSLDAKLNINVANIYLVPITYLIVLILFWNTNQISNAVLVAFVGSALTVIALSQTSSVGWYYWGFPLILLSLKGASNRSYFLVGFWQLTVVIFFFYQSNVISTRVLLISQIVELPSAKLSGIIFSLNLVIGGILIIKILKESQLVGDVYSLSKAPLSIGIAGDSGVGKDRLSNELANIFGNHEVALLLGDDYHLHERGESTLVTTTHLSPDANDIESMGRDFSLLVKRRPIYVKHYDHNVGRFTLPRKISSAQLIIINGLHAHLIPGADRIDLRIFLSMDKDLRVKFKIERDKLQRDHSDEDIIRNSITIREPDFYKYVEPQLISSDLHFHVSALSLSPLRISVQIRTRDTAFLYELRNSINAISSQSSYIEKSADGIALNIDTSNFSGEDAAIIMNQKLIAKDQLFSSNPKFSDGSDGLLALVSLLALSRKKLNRA